ncbi:MAG: TonB-dependent receptor [Cyclobacteriaceae bacterium]
MKRNIFLLTLVLSYASFAQENFTISGYVKDGNTGEDLIGATVEIKELGAGNITNVYGFYSVSIPKGTYTVAVSFIGFTAFEQRVELNSDLSINVELSTDTEVLQEVVVSSEALNKNVSSNEMSTLKISSKTVKQIPAVLGEPDIIRSIQLLPGITSVGDGSSGFNVRGGSADQNLILLDEGVIYNSAHLLGLYSAVNPDAVKDVKIYKGGIPSRFGGRLSSVLDVRQKEGNLKEYSGEGGVSLISARALFEGPIVKDKGSFMVAGRRSYGDAILRAMGQNNTAYFYDLNLKTNYTINDKNRVFASGYFGRDELSLGGIFSNGWGNTTGTFRWNRVITSRLFANFSAVYSNYDYTVDNLATGAENRISSNIITSNLKSDFSYYLQDENNLEFGLDQKWYTFNPAEIRPLKGSNISSSDLDKKYAIEQGVYANYHGELGKLLFDLGARYSRFVRRGDQNLPMYENNAPVLYNSNLDRYEEGIVSDTKSYKKGGRIKTYDNWEPRVGLTYVLNDAQSIKVSYNRMYQYLHLISNSTSPTPVDVWAPSGTYIKPQMSDQFALGYFRNLKNNAYEASVEVYYKEIGNMVDYVDGAKIIANNQIETQILAGDGRSFGAEFYLKKNTGRLTGWISYTLSQSERKVTGLGENDPGINNGKWYATNFNKLHDLSITGIYKLTDRWSLAGNFILASGLPSTYPKGRYEYAGIVVPHFEERNQDQLPTYHRLDLSATLKIKPKNGRTDRGEWVFGIYNVYNRINANSIYFKEDDTNPGQTNAFKSYLFGTTPNVTYNFKF